MALRPHLAMGLPLSGRVFLDGRRVHRGCQCDCLASRGTQNLEIAGPSKPSGDRSPDRLLVRGAERVIFKIRSPMFTVEAIHSVKPVLTKRLEFESQFLDEPGVSRASIVLGELEAHLRTP